jgi:hypothetical protein
MKLKKEKKINNLNEMISTSAIQGVNLPLIAKPIKTNAYEIGNSYDARNNSFHFFKIKDDPKHKRKKKKKRKNFTDRIKDIEHNYINDIRDNSYLMSYGPGAIGF